MLRWFALTSLICIAGWAQAPSLNVNQDLSVATDQPKILENVGIEEKVGAHLDLADLVRNEKGEMVPLGTYFDSKRPVILSLVYYSCPGLCNYHLNGLTDGLRELDWSAGQKYQIIALSFDPKEDAALATLKKESYMKVYGRVGTENGWHFLTADEATIKKITNEVGFSYRWDEEAKQWAHSSAAIMVSPDGKIVRYLNGILFDGPTLKMAITEAGGGKVGAFVDRMILSCFHWDPKQSKYVVYAGGLMRVAGGVMVLVMAALLVPTWVRARRRTANVKVKAVDV